MPLFSLKGEIRQCDASRRIDVRLAVNHFLAAYWAFHTCSYAERSAHDRRPSEASELAADGLGGGSVERRVRRRLHRDVSIQVHSTQNANAQGGAGEALSIVLARPAGWAGSSGVMNWRLWGSWLIPK